MEKPKAGLHKKISSIFDGVPVPGAGDGQQSSSAAAAGFKGHIPSRPPPAPIQTHIHPRMPQSLPAKPDFRTGIPKKSFGDEIIEKLGTLKLGHLADKQNIKILIIPLLFIILIFVFYRNFAGSSQSAQKDTETPNIKNAADITASASAIVWQKPEPYPVYMRDPTQVSAAGVSVAGTGSIAVKGIVYSEDKPSAVIGNEIMYEGDTIGGVTVLKINNDSVEFSGQGKVWTQKVQ